MEFEMENVTRSEITDKLEETCALHAGNPQPGSRKIHALKWELRM